MGGTSLEDLEPDQIEIRKSMIDTDPPRHGELRDITRRDFTPRAVGVYEEQIRQTFRWLLADALARREFDFVEHVSVELPMRVFAELLGAPLEDRLYIVDLGNRILGNDDPEFSGALTKEERQAYRDLPFSSPAAAEMFAYGQKLAALRRQEPRDDLVTDLLEATPGGSPLTEREFNVYFLLLATAGNETTRHAISSAVHLLAQHPEVIARLREEPGLSGKAADEMMRWANAGAPLPADRDARRRGLRADDPPRRQGADLVRGRKLGRGRLRRSLPGRPGAHAEQAPDVRARGTALLPRRAPGAARAAESCSRSSCPTSIGSS